MAQVVLMETVSTIKPQKDKEGHIYFEGMFGLAGKRNLNGRIYPKTVMEKSIKDYNDNFISKRRGMGELDHPEDASVNLKNVAFVIEDPLELKENGEVYGRARILENLPMGKIAADLIREEITIGLSSRGLGEITEKKELDEETGKEVDVMEVSDFTIASFDLVSEPSIGHFVSHSIPKKETVEKPKEKKLEESLNIDDLLRINDLLFE